MTRFRPGCILRSTLAFVGIVFLPIAIFFIWSGKNVRDGIILLGVSIVFLVLTFDRRDNSLLSRIDELGERPGGE